jgi:hypothetical protein
MKIVEFFLILLGKWPEPEPEFLTSWSRSRTKMDRLRNTGVNRGRGTDGTGWVTIDRAANRNVWV